MTLPRITPHEVLIPYGDPPMTSVAKPAGMPAVPYCRPTVFHNTSMVWARNLKHDFNVKWKSTSKEFKLIVLMVSEPASGRWA